MKCRLWGALSSQAAGSAELEPFCLPASPEAILGSILHKLDELAAKGLIEVPVADDAADPYLVACGRAFRELLQQREELVDPEIAHVVPLSRSIPYDIFNRRKAAGLRRAAAVLRHLPRHTRTVPSTRRGGHEDWFESTMLRLKGRVDRWFLDEGNGLVVEDLKTGALSDDAIEQLQLYALLVLEQTGMAGALLRIVGHDRADETPFTPGDAAATRARVAHVLEELPADALKPFVALATAGEHCGRCQYRPACAAYHALARATSTADKERSASSLRLPFDAWGEVTAVARSNSLTRIEIRDDGGRRVVLDRLALGVDLPIIGQTVSAYDLLPLHSANGMRGAQATTLREVPTSLGGRRAFRATLIVRST